MKNYQLLLVVCAIASAVAHNSMLSLPLTGQVKKNLLAAATEYMKSPQGQSQGIEPWIQKNQDKLQKNEAFITIIRNKFAVPPAQQPSGPVKLPSQPGPSQPSVPLQKPATSTDLAELKKKSSKIGDAYNKALNAYENVAKAIQTEYKDDAASIIQEMNKEFEAAATV